MLNLALQALWKGGQLSRQSFDPGGCRPGSGDGCKCSAGWGAGGSLRDNRERWENHGYKRGRCM